MSCLSKERFFGLHSVLVASGSAFSNVLKAKEDLQKSHEQLEQEKRSVLAQRVQGLQLDGKTKDDLIEKAKQFHNLLQQLHGAIYELTERFERQKYDVGERELICIVIGENLI